MASSRTVRARWPTQNAEAYLDQMLRLLRVDGVRFPDNSQMEFTRLEPITGRSGAIHAEGRWHPKDESDPDADGRRTVCVAFGPQYGPVTAQPGRDAAPRRVTAAATTTW